jgi:hypothetical protein
VPQDYDRMGESLQEERNNLGNLEILILEPVYHERIETDLGKIYCKEAVLGIKNQLLADYLKSLTKKKLSYLGIFDQTHQEMMLVVMSANSLQALGWIIFLFL